MVIDGGKAAPVDVTATEVGPGGIADRTMATGIMVNIEALRSTLEMPTAGRIEIGTTTIATTMTMTITTRDTA